MSLTRLLLARPVEGTVGERQRVTHLVYVPEARNRALLARACCGQAFGPGDLELLDGVAGMPCEACLRHAPINNAEGVLTDGDLIVSRLTGLEAQVELLAELVDRVGKRLSQATITFPGEQSNVEG
ncbi:hypothetical protein [Amycolatopsis pithecellobii]|uniref:hypothetical protein n=1 Tax=Amycolatopsis pithecellobii TaxID=664692 RepID=UPI001AA02132|nr:hypothetical protein [Amycolatopsis pithecellobii]